ncbi:circularly permuted type 2 ATP-grasp protein [Akkermansiaceae bacterium]|nr:circularly permuted type 2 ATP-grasp protein [Akkermansiaceae bacterium]
MALPSWFYQYAKDTDKYDELIDENGNIRPHWSGLVNRLSQLSDDTWQKRKTQLDKLILDYGITYNLNGIHCNGKEMWDLDLLPLAIQDSEIKDLEAKLSQRAFLLDLVLQDTYGRQLLLKDGNLDPFLLLANPNYLRSCHGLLPNKSRHLHFYVAELVRCADGTWKVAADKIESAGGLGYTLENRDLMSRVFPVAIAESRVQSLKPFANHFSSYVESLVPSYVDSPNIALLSAGPHSDSYFEHSYLSRNLGFHLVEGADLTVRNNHLYMKTVKGVKPVNALLRKVNSPWCDPLELNDKSLLGVPGLLNTVRKGNLAVANALGSGFAETAAIPALLPWFSRKFLGESLEIESVSTWWCGDKNNLSYVLENIPNLLIKPTFLNKTTQTIVGAYLNLEQKQNLIRRIKESPERYCATENAQLADVPTIHQIYGVNSLQPRPYKLRVVMIPSGDGWKIMPGGLVNFPKNTGSQLSSFIDTPLVSKDLWVIRPKSTTQDKNQAPENSADPQKTKKARYHEEDLASRSADNLFWLGRYLERSEALTRILNTTANMLVTHSGSSNLPSITPFINILPRLPAAKKQAKSKLPELKPKDEFQRMQDHIMFAFYDTASHSNLYSSFKNIQRISSSVKERLSNDSWQKLAYVCQLADNQHPKTSPNYNDEVISSLHQILDNLAAFNGNLMENMTRGLGWYFLQIGRCIERIVNAATLFKQVFIDKQIHNETTLENLLLWGESSITYRRHYLNLLHAENVLDVLCFDKTNPRSMCYQANSIRELLEQLPHSSLERNQTIDTFALSIYSKIALTRPVKLVEAYDENNPFYYTYFFDHIIGDCLSLAFEIEQKYFAHIEENDEENH